MKANVLAKANAFKGMNEIALRGEIVIYGSTYLSNFPFYELANRCHLEHAIYNRSIETLTAEEAEELLNLCVLDIAPRKIFLQLGEEDAEKETVIQYYQTILQRIRTGLPCAKIYLLGLSQDTPDGVPFNRKLQSFTDGKHIFYIPFSENCANRKHLYTDQFKQLSQYFRDGSINLLDAFEMADL